MIICRPNHCIKKFSIKNFFSKCDHIRRELRIMSHLLKKLLNLKVVTSVVAGKVFREYVQFLRNNCIGIMINCLLLNGNRID